MSNTSSEEPEVYEAREQFSSEIVTRFLWVLVPVLVGGVVTMFTSINQEMQIIIWGVMALIIMFGLWASRAKTIRKKREEVEQKRWDALLNGLDEKWDDLHSGLDARFDRVDERFDEMDARFDLVEKANMTLLRNELVKMHREWVEERGYITLEALEYADRIHDAYSANTNTDADMETGDQLWKNLHALPIKERRIRD